MHQESEIRDPLILGKKTYHDITKEIALPVEGKANKYSVSYTHLTLPTTPYV